MENDTNADSTRWISSARAADAAKVLDAAQGLFNLVSEYIRYRETRERCRTRRVEIRAARDVALADIAARREAMMRMLDGSFAARRGAFDALFRMLDEGIRAGRLDVVGQAADRIVALAATNPLCGLASANDVRRALRNPKLLEKL